MAKMLNDMADELENSEAIKNDFISSVSHELRTPLTAIKGWSETLEAGYDEETYRKGMKVITHETGRLEGMVGASRLLAHTEWQIHAANGKYRHHSRA